MDVTIKILLFSKDGKIISWTGHKEFDKSNNMLKVRCLQVIIKILRYYKSSDKDYVKLYTDVAFEVLKNLEFVIKEKLEYMKNLDEDNYPDNGYEPLVYFLLDYLYYIFKQDPIIQTFNTTTIRM